MTSDKPTVRDLVMRQQSGGLFYVTPAVSVQEAARSMQSHGVSAICVMAEGGGGFRLAGILSEKDISHLVARGGDPARTRVQDIMTVDVHTVDIDTPLWETATFMLHHNVRHLPVLQDGQPFSTISMRDVLGLVVERLAAEVDSLRAHIDWIGFMSGQSSGPG